jgi:hypothetical protein
MEGLRILHPLDDVAEEQCSTVEHGKIKMTKMVRVSPGIQRGYLILKTLMLGYHVLDLAGVSPKVRSSRFKAMMTLESKKSVRKTWQYPPAS